MQFRSTKTVILFGTTATHTPMAWQSWFSADDGDETITVHAGPQMFPTSPIAEVTLALPARPEDLAAAAELGIQVVAADDPTQWQLRRRLGALELHTPAALGPLSISVRFGEGALAQRLRTARRTDPLPRAFGLARRDTPPTVVDATAGLCRDAAVLARLGCTVTAIERVPALALLTRDAAAATRFAGTLRVVAAEALDWLRDLPAAERPEAVYLDPMFEEAGKAQVKKEMQVCRALCAAPEDATALLEVARQVARERVVVKRHGKGAPLAPGVSFAVGGERVRFDVYLTAAPLNGADRSPAT
ncbi:MAG: class I SAM-dependent methyltransferase [Planctomycetes bacterium]|nr:class I SAM-dependent methyltransferase [Planctomycetota bacterium]MCB9886191.1 class I SAM-dependent methyltransferase [Planctomycetota bacterium]